MALHLSITIFVCSLLAAVAVGDSSITGTLVVVNQAEAHILLVDLATQKVVASLAAGINPHEVAVSPNGKFAFSPIYGDSGVGKPGSNGQSIAIIDLEHRRVSGEIDLGQPVRPHCAKFAPDGLLYVSAELANAVFAVDTQLKKVVAQIPTGQEQSHMFVISPDGHRAYTANVSTGSVSVLDLQNRALITTIPVAKKVQRISISPDGRQVFTHDQDSPRIAVINTATNQLSRWLDLPATVYSSAPTPDGHWLLANSTSGKLFVWDLTAGKLSNTFAIPAGYGEIVVAPDGSRAYLTCAGAGTVETLNLSTWKLETPITLTHGVDGLALLPR